MSKTFVASPLSSQWLNEGREIRGCRKNGEEFPAEASLAKLQVGDHYFLTVVTRDITERVQRKEKRARVLTKERAARVQAEEAIRLRDVVLAAVTHDLKNPLATVRVALQALQRQVVRRDPPEEFEEELQRIAAALQQLATLVDELLDVARLQMGQPLTLNRQSLDLVALVQRVAAEQQQTTERHQITVEATTPSVVGRWDPVRLEQVVRNLLSNAIKYSPEGGTISVSVTQGKERAVLTVRDPGIGISTEDLSRIFKPFQRGRNIGNSILGTGIGLATVRQIVEQHGGDIVVASAEGKGTTVTVRLPLRAPAAES